VIRAAAVAEARGWAASQEKNHWYLEYLTKKRLKVLPPGNVLMADLKQVGEQLTVELHRKAGAEGLAVIQAYTKNR
jgi:TRAP-type transport system periplasmic protein